MKPNSPIFESAFIRLIESFAHHFHKILNEFEDEMAISSKSNANHIIQNIFIQFPRCSSPYLKLIQKFTELASFDPTSIISDLSNSFLNVLNQSENTLFQVLQNSSLIFKHGNIYHQEILTRFAIYLITDLTCQILREYGYKESCERLTACGINICQNPNSHKFIDDPIIKQWAVIFSFISEANFQLIFEMFKTIINFHEYEYAFFLIQYVRLDCCPDDSIFNFLLEIYKIMTSLQNENKLTETILKSISHLLLTQKKYYSPLDDIFSLVWNLKNDTILQDEAIGIICVLFPLLPSKKDQTDKFYQDYVLLNLDDSSKVKKKLQLFQILIYGIQYDPRWFCWEWGPTPRLHQYSYLKWNSQPSKPLSDSTSFLSIFMRTFFQKSDFSVCYNEFSSILLHFAALDFPFFIQSVMDAFLSVANTDSRFVSFLMMIPKVNTPDFIDYSSKTVTFSDMGTFNERVKSKVVDALSLFTAEFLADHGICGEQINAVKALIYSCDRKVEKRLEEWKFSKFNKTVIDHHITRTSPAQTADNSIQVHLARCMPFIIPIEDYDTPEKLRLILQLSFNSSVAISSVAFPVCQTIITDDMMQIKFIEIILEYIKGPTSCESLFTCINLLNEMLLSNPQELPLEVLHNIEFAGIRGSVSVHPSCRLISVRLLKMVNFVLGGNGCFNFVELNLDEIQKVANRQLFSHYLSDQNTISGNLDFQANDANLTFNSPSQKSHQNASKMIKFNEAACSHYFDVWLYFVSEIANIIVSVNYAPLLDRFRTNLDCYIRTLIRANTENENSEGEAKFDHADKHAINRAHFYAYPDLSSGDITNLFTPSSSDSQMNVGLLTYYLAAHFDIEFLAKVSNLYRCQLHQPYGEKDGKLQEKVVLTMRGLMHVGGLQKLSFSVLKHAHVSLYPLLINMLCKATPEQYENSAAAARVMLLSPMITPQFARALLSPVIDFLSVIEKFIVEQKANYCSMVNWDGQMEATVEKFERLSIDFCIIIGIALKKINGKVSIDIWPLTSRESIFVFLMNWMKTKSAKLDSLRFQASNALISLSQAGPMINHSNLFDQISIEIISKIEKRRSSILSSILYNHVELLLDTFVDSFYTVTSSNSNLILLSLFSSFDAEFSDFLYKRSAPLLLLGFTIHVCKSPHSFEFMSALIDLITFGQLSIESIQTLVTMSSDNRLENGISSMINRYLMINGADSAGNRELSSMLLSQMSRSNSSNSISKFTQNGLNGRDSMNWIFSKARNSLLAPNPKDDSNGQKASQNSTNGYFGKLTSIDRLLNEIAKQLAFATESVFREGFKILRMKDSLRVSVKDIVGALSFWCCNIQIRPNSTFVTRACPPPDFHVFAPYEFLDELMKTTEIVGRSDFSSMVSLWATLLKNDEQADIIMNFLFDFQWSGCLSKSSTFRKRNSKQKLLARLVSTEPERVIGRIAQRCSFAYFYHVTVCLKKSFENELWIAPLLAEAFLTTTNKDRLVMQVPSILHFAFLFMEKGTGELLRALCSTMSIEIPEGPLSRDMLISIVKRFVSKFKAKNYKLKKTKKSHIRKNSEKNSDDNRHNRHNRHHHKIECPDSPSAPFGGPIGESGDDFIEVWGTEVVKWILGTSSLHIATVSLSIFNQLLRPIDPLVISGICKSVVYHISANRDDISIVSKLIHESFVFYASVFDGNELFAFNYALSFIDCKLFVDTCLDKAAKLFMKCLTSAKTSAEAWTSVVSMIRPFLPKLEKDKKTQKMFEVLLKNHSSKELLLIVLPINICHRELFATSINEFLTSKNEEKVDVYSNNLGPNKNTNQNDGFYSYEDSDNYVSYYNYDSGSDQDFIHFDDQKEFIKIIESTIPTVDELTLSKALTHYSLMIGSASLDLMNSIFIVSSCIIKHISAESNKESLKIIYKNALKVFPSCPNSIDFISAIVSFNLNVEKKNGVQMSDWERSIDCVITSLCSLLQKEKGSEVKVTDCGSIQSVYNLLNCIVVPKILPFAEQQKMIDEMKLIVKNNNKSGK